MPNTEPSALLHVLIHLNPTPPGGVSSSFRFYRVLLFYLVCLNSLSEWHQLGKAGSEVELYFNEVSTLQQISPVLHRTTQFFWNPKFPDKFKFSIIWKQPVTFLFKRVTQINTKWSCTLFIHFKCKFIHEMSKRKLEHNSDAQPGWRTELSTAGFCISVIEEWSLSIGSRAGWKWQLSHR